MVKTPYIFSPIQRKPFSSNTTFGDQMPLEMSPEPYKAIEASALGSGEFAFATVYDDTRTRWP